MYAKLITSKGTHESLIECDKVYFRWDSDTAAGVIIQRGNDSVEWILGPGDKVFVMNEVGRTIDSYLVPDHELLQG